MHNTEETRMMTEGQHGLGIGQSLPTVLVEQLRGHLWRAAFMVNVLGVNQEHLLDLWEATMDGVHDEELEHYGEDLYDFMIRRRQAVEQTSPPERSL